MPITKATGQAVAPAAKGDLVVGSATNDAAVLNVGSANQVLTVDSSTTTGLKWAAPASTGITWTSKLNPTGTAFTRIGYNGSNMYVAVGEAGQLYSSPDAQTWTSRTSGFGANNIRDINFGNGLWVAVGNNGTITTSSDAITWTARTANMSTNTILAVQYANSIWVAVGNGGGATNTGGITYSTDGITWTRKSQSITVGSSYNDITWNGTNWVIAAQLDTNNYLYASTPSGTWTAGLAGTSHSLTFIYWDGTRHIFGNTNQTVYYSTSTTLASSTNYSGFAGPSAGRIYTWFTSTTFYFFYSYIFAITQASTSRLGNTQNLGLFPGATYAQTTVGFAEHPGTFWKGTAGYIAATDAGEIYTSF